MVCLFYSDASSGQRLFQFFFFFRYSRRCELLRSYEHQHGCIPSFEQSQEGTFALFIMLLFAPMAYYLALFDCLYLFQGTTFEELCTSFEWLHGEITSRGRYTKCTCFVGNNLTREMLWRDCQRARAVVEWSHFRLQLSSSFQAINSISRLVSTPLY